MRNYQYSWPEGTVPRSHTIKRANAKESWNSYGMPRSRTPKYLHQPILTVCVCLHQQHKITTQAVINKIDEAEGWYFNRVRICHMKISDGFPRWHCQEFGAQPTPNYRYKLYTHEPRPPSYNVLTFITLIDNIMCPPDSYDAPPPMLSGISKDNEEGTYSQNRKERQAVQMHKSQTTSSMIIRWPVVLEIMFMQLSSRRVPLICTVSARMYVL